MKYMANTNVPFYTKARIIVLLKQHG